MIRQVGLLISVLILATPFEPLTAHEPSKKSQCETIKQQIRRIEARMRQGYTAAQGVRLSERLRELRARRSKHCR